LNLDSNVSKAWEQTILRYPALPNDSFYVAGDQWDLEVMSCSTAWDSSKGSGTVIAIVDGGTLLNHQDLLEDMWYNVNDSIGDMNDDGCR
jgi:subtilisin family serine protease